MLITNKVMDINGFKDIFSASDNKETPTNVGVFAVNDKADSTIDAEPNDKLVKLAEAFAEADQQTDYLKNNASEYQDFKDYEKYGVVINNKDTDLDAQRAKNQSAWEQFGASLYQGIVGEVVGGTVAGFGAIGDMVIGAMFDKDNDYTNPVTQLGDAIRDHTREATPIYQVNPEKSLDFGDSGYIFSRLPSVLSSLSLLIPSKAVVSGVSMVGKIGRVSKFGRAITKAGQAGKYGSVAKKALTPYNIAKGKSYVESAFTALGMRVGENYQESRQVYNDIKEETSKALREFNDKDYQKFIEGSDPKVFEGVDLNDREAVANRIASASADRTFAWDMVNFVSDFIQLRALSSAWKNMANRPASLRLTEANKAAANTINRSATEIADMSKKTASSKVLNGLKRNLIGAKLTVAAELGEGVEEAVNHIASKEGMLYGRILNGTIDKNDSKSIRDARNYLMDPEMYDAALWGVIGGVVFHNLANGFTKVSNKLRKIEDVDNKTRLAEIEARKGKWDNYIKNVDLINQGFDPTSPSLDDTGAPIFVDGNRVYDKLESEEAKEDVKNRLTEEMVTELALNAIRVGNYELLNDYINDPSFKQRMIEAGVATEEDYDKDTANIGSIIDNTYQAYSNYSNLLRNAGVEDMYLSIMIDRNIYNDLSIKRAEANINKYRDANSKLAETNPKIQELKNTANLDSRLRVGVIQEKVDYINKEIAKREAGEKGELNDLSTEELKTLRTNLNTLLDKETEGLSVVEKFKASIQTRVYNGENYNEIEEDITKFKEENPDIEFDSEDNLFNFELLRKSIDGINSQYLENIDNSIMTEAYMLDYQNNKILTEAQVRAESEAIAKEMEAKKKLAIEISKAQIMAVMNTDEYEAAYNYLNGDKNASLKPETKKLLDQAKDVLNLLDDAKFKQAIEAEYNKAKQKRNVPTPVEENQPPAPTPASTNEKVNPSPAPTNKTDEEQKFENAAKTLSELNTTILTENDLQTREFKVIKPFTHKGAKYVSVEIFHGNFGSSINIADEAGMEINIGLDQLTYLVENGFISSTGVGEDTDGNVEDDTNDDSPYPFSNDNEGIDNAVNRFQVATEMIDSYVRLVNSRKDAKGRALVSLEELLRYTKKELGAKVAKGVFKDVKLTLQFMMDMNNSVVITDNEAFMKKSRTKAIETISKPIEEIIKEDTVDNTASPILQSFLVNKLTANDLRTAEDVAYHNAVMSLKKGDVVTAKINDVDVIEFYNGDILIGAAPRVQLSSTGQYIAVNEHWEYVIDLKGNNAYGNSFIEDLKHLIDVNNNDEAYGFLEALDNFRIALNTKQNPRDRFKEVLKNEAYKKFVAKHGVETDGLNAQYVQLNHLIKILGYKYNVNILSENFYTIIAPTLDAWVDKLGNNYNEIFNFKAKMDSGKFNIVVEDSTSGVLVKEVDTDGKPVYRPVQAVIRNEDSDNMTIYFDNGARQINDRGDVIEESIGKPGPVIYTTDSQGRKIHVNVFAGIETRGYNSADVNTILDSVNGIVDEIILETLKGDDRNIKNLIDKLRSYTNDQMLIKGMNVSSTPNGYMIRYSNGHSLAINIKDADNFSVIPIRNGQPIVNTGNNGRQYRVGYYQVNDRNKRTPESSLESIHKGQYMDNGIGINFSSVYLMENGNPNAKYKEGSPISAEEDNTFVINLPNGKVLKYKDYKSFLLSNNILKTDVGFVRGPNGENLGNFKQAGEGIGYDKNLYFTAVPKNAPKPKRQAKPKEVIVKPKDLKGTVKQGTSLTEISNMLAITEYDEIIKVLDGLGVKVSTAIENNRKDRNANAKYNPSTNEIILYNKFFTLDSNRQVRVLVHEALHHYIRQMANYGNLHKDFINLFNFYKAHVSSQTNPDVKAKLESYLDGKTESIQIEEFIVRALTNKDFATILNEINYTGSTKKGEETKSIFKKLLDIMVNLVAKVGNIKEGSMLEEINNIFTNFQETFINQNESGTETKTETKVEEKKEEKKEEVKEEINKEDIDIAALDQFIDDIEIDDEFYSNDIEASDKFGSVNSLINRMTNYERSQFERLNKESAINIRCN